MVSENRAGFGEVFKKGFELTTEETELYNLHNERYGKLQSNIENISPEEITVQERLIGLQAIIGKFRNEVLSIIEGSALEINRKKDSPPRAIRRTFRSGSFGDYGQQEYDSNAYPSPEMIRGEPIDLDFSDGSMILKPEMGTHTWLNKGRYIVNVYDPVSDTILVDIKTIPIDEIRLNPVLAVAKTMFSNK